MNMSFEGTLQASFKAVRKYPKVLLPVMLNWIPTTMLYFVIYDILSGYNDIFSFIRSVFIGDTFPPVMTIFWTLFPYLMIFLGIGVLYALINIFLISVYTRITVGFYDKSIDLVKIFADAKGDIKSLLWTYLLIFIILVGISSGLVILGILFFPLGFILTFLGMISLIIFSIVFLFEIPPVVVLEDESGFSALKRSKELAKGRKIIILVLVSIVTFASGFVNSLLNYIPFVGQQLAMLSMLFFTVWQLMLSTVFYKEYIIS